MPAIALVVVAFFLNPQQNPAQARPDPAAVRRQIERSSEGLQVRLAEKREQAKKQGLKDAPNPFQKLEQELGDHGKIEGDKADALASSTTSPSSWRNGGRSWAERMSWKSSSTSSRISARAR